MSNNLSFIIMYNVFIYYRVPDSDELRYQKVYGVYLNTQVIDWLRAYPNMQYWIVEPNKSKEVSI